MTDQPVLTLPSGREIARMGFGTWRMGEIASRFDAEVEAVRTALDTGYRLIDTAEMYGEGGAERVIGEAIRGRRDEVFLVSKVYPHNAAYDDLQQACERSLNRLQTDCIDLYLLHWPGGVPLSETFAAFHALQEAGRIRDFGVSNFDLSDLEDIPSADQARLGCNQVFYNLAHRETEWAVSDWCQQRGVPIMAYSPLDQASSLLQASVLNEVAAKHDASAAQIALAWLLHRPNTIVIPKSAHPERVRENFAALEIDLDADDLGTLDQAFPAPSGPVRLGMR